MANLVFKPNFFIFTGGPGSGKTTTLAALEKLNYKVVPEGARPIIQQQQAIGGNALHTGDREAFLNLLLQSSIQDYQGMQHEKTAVFFDRGIPDLVGYAKAFCKKESRVVFEAVSNYRYNKTVFIFPPWEEIYKNDRERQQDFTESLETYLALKEAYLHCDYDLVEIPKTSVEKRIEFILSTLTKTCLTELKNDVNTLLGFHEGTPRINYGPCGVFAQLFFDAWNDRFQDKVHLVFIMMKAHEECWHITLRLPTGELYDGGIGIHTDEYYDNQTYSIEEMLVYDHKRLEKWSYGLDREYPRFCPNFNKAKVNAIIEHHLDCMAIKR